MFKRILFAHNATPAAERALLYVEHLARVEEAEVIVLHVYEKPSRYAATHGYEELLAALEAVAQEVVNDATTELQREGIEARGIITAGDPARQIIDIAHQEEVSLIVLGTRGPSNVKELLLGEVSAEVLRYAHCPVLLVP